MRGVRVEPQRAAGEEFGVEVTEDDAGVGHRGLRPAAPVAGRARVRTRRPGSDPEVAGRVDPCEASAARPDRRDVHHRYPERIRVDGALGREKGLVGLDQADVGAGSTDVDGDQVLQAGKRARVPRAYDAGSRAGEQDGHRAVGHQLRRGHAPTRLHDLKRGVDPDLSQLARQLVYIPVDDRSDVCVKGRHDSPFVLPEHGIDLARERDAE